MNPIRPVALVLLAAAAVSAGGKQDARNTYTPNTDTHFVLPAYGTLAEWQARKVALRQQILSAAGLLPIPPKTDMHPQVFGRLDREGYSIEKVYLETMPGYYMGGNLYRPRGAGGKHPAVLIAQGHWDYGRVENQQLNSPPTEGINLARQGYVAFAYDMAGYNDNIQTPHIFGGPKEQLWSFGPLGLQTWNSIRALDFVLSLADVDGARVGITGASGGGTQTFLLTAIDDRISFAAPVNMVSAIMQGGCPCENAPGLRLGTSNLEIAALAAPRPMLLVSGTQDWTINVAKEEFPAIRRIYALYGKAENLENAVVDAPHNYNQESREHVYRFFAKHMLGAQDMSKFHENEAKIEKLGDMLVLHGRALPAGALTYEQLFAAWRERARQQAESEKDPAAIRQHLALVLGAEWPAKVEATGSDDGLILTRQGANDGVPGIFLPGRGVPALVVHPDGAAKAQQSPTVQALRKAGRPVLLIDAFQTGSCVASRNRSVLHFLAFNVTDDAARVQDVLTALAYLRTRDSGPVELIGLEGASVWALFADALAPSGVVFAPKLGKFAGTDEDFVSGFFVPGIQNAGGINAALKLVRQVSR